MTLSAVPLKVCQHTLQQQKLRLQKLPLIFYGYQADVSKVMNLCVS